MENLPSDPGPQKVDIQKYADQLFEIEKEVMASSKHLYQFQSFEEFVKCFTEEHDCEIYIWNNEQREAVGFFIHELSKNKSEDELIIIIIRPSFQNQGYGKKMMDFYFNLLKLGTKSILSTNKKNKDAIRFYKNFGYKITKELPNHYNDGETRFLLEKSF